MYYDIVLFFTEIFIYIINIFNLSIVKGGLVAKILEYDIYIKNKVTNNMFILYNHIIFKDLLKCSIVFNKRLKTTAGRCSNINKNYCHIELSPFVCNSKQKIRNILLHELCHVAVMLIDKDLQHGHGNKFKFWCQKIYNLTGDKITTYHDYPTMQNLKYKCCVCGNIKKVCNRNYLVNQSKCLKCYKGIYYEHNNKLINIF